MMLESDQILKVSFLRLLINSLIKFGINYRFRGGFNLWV